MGSAAWHRGDTPVYPVTSSGGCTSIPPPAERRPARTPWAGVLGGTYVKTILGARTRAALASTVAIGLALLVAAPASAAGGTPTTPTELFNAYQACSTDPGAPVSVAGRGGGLVVEGIPNDTDTSLWNLTEQFQYWPVSDPTQIATSSRSYAMPGNEASANLTPLTDGQTYAWQARTVDPSGAASAWSAACYVADDDTFPATAPTVTSPNYPQGQSDQSGAPIQFVLGAGGVSDVAGFEYSWAGDFPVAGVASIGDHGIPQFQDPYSDPKWFARADTLGGSATATLVPPAGWGGYLTLSVRSLDRAFNSSPTATYNIWLKPNAPTVTQLSHSPQFGKPTAFKLTPDPKFQAASPVVSYTVQHLGQNGSTTTVPASGVGTAEVDVTLDGSYGDTLLVTSTSADGWVSESTWWSNGYLDTSPTVTSNAYAENGSSGGAGVPGTFSFTPKVKSADVASYTYSFNWGQGTTVAAGAHGDAQISWTPSQSGWYDLEVYATTKDGVQLAPYDYYFTVN